MKPTPWPASLTKTDREMFERFKIPGDLVTDAHIERLKDMQGWNKWRLPKPRNGSFAGVVFPYTNRADTEVVSCRVRRDHPEMKKGKPENKYLSPEGDHYVFARDGGKPVKDFRGAWRNLCVRSGTGHRECGRCKAVLTGAKCECGGSRKYAGLIPHDFRRSAAKALRRAGVSESVIMAIGGWKTPSMFRRYAIVSNTDQRAAVEMLERAREVEKTSKPPVRPPNQETEQLGDEQERTTIQ